MSPRAAAAKPASAPPLGEIAYLEGEVELRRGGLVLKGSALDFGTPVQAYDLLVTGPRSKAEVDLGGGRSGGGIIKVAERSAFYFDAKDFDDGSRSTVIRLLAGSLALKVEKLGGGSFTLSTGNTVLGVRGTIFSVDTSPDGSLLVSCAEGRVAVRGPDGSELAARPGNAVEGTEEGSILPKLLPAERLAAYRSTWLLTSRETLALRGASLAGSLAQSLEKARPAFEAAMAELRAQEPILRTWEEGLAAGRTFRFTEGLEEKKAVAQRLLVCLKALPAVELPYYRLGELQSLRDSGIAVGGAPRPGAPSLDQALGLFAAAHPKLDTAMGELFRALSLFSRVASDSPLGEFFGDRGSGALGGGSLFEPGW